EFEELLLRIVEVEVARDVDFAPTLLGMREAVTHRVSISPEGESDESARPVDAFHSAILKLAFHGDVIGQETHIAALRAPFEVFARVAESRAEADAGIKVTGGLAHSMVEVTESADGAAG